MRDLYVTSLDEGNDRLPFEDGATADMEVMHAFAKIPREIMSDRLITPRSQLR